MKNEMELNSEDLIRIIDSLHDEIMIFDKDYKLIFVNSACERHYGISKEQLIGKKFEELHDVYWGNSTLPIVYKTGKIAARRQITNLGADIITISVPVFDEDGKIEYVAQNVNDIYYLDEVMRKEKETVYSEDDGSETAPYIGHSESVKSMISMVRNIGSIDAPCLITGETGCGKSYFANYMHTHSSRRDKKISVINCASIPASLFESELFGYAKGAFTGANVNGKKGMVAEAEGGTLFLDEISEIPIELQSKLLRFIQDKKYTPVGCTEERQADVRIIAATNRNLSEMIKSKTFREDLYYRINTFEITIPPLRERPEDINDYLDYYLNRFCSLYNRNLVISEEARDILNGYSWPGNIRELEHMIEKLVVLAKGTVVSVNDIPKNVFSLSKPSAIKPTELPYTEETDLDKALSDYEGMLVRKAYEKYRTSTGVAKALNISQPKAYRLISRYCMGNSDKT